MEGEEKIEYSRSSPFSAPIREEAYTWDAENGGVTADEPLKQLEEKEELGELQDIQEPSSSRLLERKSGLYTWDIEKKKYVLDRHLKRRRRSPSSVSREASRSKAASPPYTPKAPAPQKAAPIPPSSSSRGPVPKVPKRQRPTPASPSKPFIPPTVSSDPSPDPSRARVSSIRPSHWRRSRKNLSSDPHSIHSILASRLGVTIAWELLEKIDRSLKEHAEKGSEFRSFLVRSYQRQRPKKDLSFQDAQALMRKGIYRPGSLKAILRNIKREFKKKPLESYSLSKLFGISRSNAKFILSQLYRL